MRDWAQVAQFYGWTFDDIRSLTIDEYDAARRYLSESRQRQGQ